VVKLAREHGIVTPYTAYLIVEDEMRRGVPEISRTFRELESDHAALDAAKGFTTRPCTNRCHNANRQGQQAVGNATEYNRLEKWLERAADRCRPPAPAAAEPSQLSTASGAGGVMAGRYSGAYDAMTKSAQTQPASDVTGYRAPAQLRPADPNRQRQGVLSKWQHLDRRRRPATPRTRSASASVQQRGILQLARASSSNAQWLSLGNDVDVVIGDTIYEVRDE
jgi:hypothetical protein